MAGASLSFGCTCGKIRGTLHDVTQKAGTQLQCHCADCRRAIVFLGQPDPGADGVIYYQTSPSHVTFDKGGDTIQAFIWKNTKLLRWYAPCCNAPLFNTLHSPKWAFASMITDRLDDPTALGPVRARAFVPKPNGKQGYEGMFSFMGGFAKRVIGARLSGSWKQTPFFDADGSPITKVKTLTSEDRATAQL